MTSGLPPARNSPSFADQLNVPLAGLRTYRDLRSLLRTAALQLQNTSAVVLEADVQEAIDLLAVEQRLPRSEVIQGILRAWLVGAGRLYADTVDEERPTSPRSS